MKTWKYLPVLLFKVPLPTKSITTHKLDLSEAEKSIYDRIFTESQ